MIGVIDLISFDPLWEWLTKHNRSIYEIARSKGTSKLGGMTIDNIKAGKSNITLATIDKLCDFYGCKPKDVFKYIPTPTDKPE